MRIDKLWFPEPAAAALAQIKPGMFGIVYWKKIKDTKGPGGKIIMRVCGDTAKETEELAAHVCKLHNENILKKCK